MLLKDNEDPDLLFSSEASLSGSTLCSSPGIFFCIKLLVQSFYRVGYGILVTMTVMNPIW